DIRKILLENRSSDSPVTDVMTKNPVVISENTPVEHVLDEIQRQIQASSRRRAIKHAVLIDDERHVLGLIDVGKLVLSESVQWDTIGLIGLGYVGFTVALALAERGFRVIGFDSDEDIRNTLSKGLQHIYEPNLGTLLKVQLEKKALVIASSLEELKKSRAFMICVNTPVDSHQPELTYLKEAVSALTKYLKLGDLVIIRSTVPVGTCRNVIKKIIENQTEYSVGEDIGLAYAPERTLAGHAMEELRSLPQVIGGINEWSARAAARVFSRLSPTIIQVDTLEEAEMIKLINNVFRDVSFAFANEVATMCEAYNIDASKLIRAANSGYPRNPISLPSPGVGGSCLIKDPYIFLASKKESNMPSLAEISRQINEQMPKNIERRLLDILQRLGKKPAECTFYVLGFAFKGDPETTDLRGSPTLDLVADLQKKVGAIYGWDAIVPKADVEETGIAWKDPEEGFDGADIVLFMNNHRSFANMDVYTLLNTMNKPAIFFDGWGIFDADEIEQIADIHYVGISHVNQTP
ncbi:nucleotide sugar dehydrogenase, partial [Chloroflexota bacterium]